ncbi:unnamed protein product [Closterium sp. Naga37s-1]|nr:unnamed protein product [Closterium sp. Naga37s-1]
MMSYSHSSPLRPSAPHALDAHQRKSPNPRLPPAPSIRPSAPLRLRLARPGLRRTPRSPCASLSPPLPSPTRNHTLQSHPPQSHAPLSRPTHSPPRYRPPPQGPPATAKPAGGATGGAAGGAGGRLPGGVIGVGVSAAAGGALMVVAGHSGLDKMVEGYKLAGWLILTLRSVFSMLQQPAAGIMEGIVDKVVEGYKLAGHGSYSLGSTLPLLHCMCHLVTMLTPVAGLMEGIVDKVVEGYKLAGLVQQLALHGYQVLALRMLRAALCAALAGSMSLLPILSLLPSLPALPPHVSIPGSMLPFALRWLAAELPHPMGNPALTLERLCTLQAYCTAKQPDRMGNPALTLERLCALQAYCTAQLRRQAVRHALVSHHLAQRDYPTALLWLQRLLRYEPSNAALISRYGLVRLQLGDMEGASAAFGLVEKMVVHREVEMESEGGSGGGGGEEAGEGEGGGEATGDASNTAGAGAGGAGAGATGAGGGSDGGVGAGRVTAANVGEMKRLLQLNKALVHFARKEHGQALQLFTAVTKEDPTNSVAANNKALCLMYGRDLATAVQVLEDQLQASPLTAVDETVVLNLCSMYELAASDTLNAKSTLSNWLTRLAPDDFDFACTRL